MHLQTWKPDTCGCIVVENVPETGNKTLASVTKKCPAHSGVLDNDLYGILYANPDGENKVKNIVMAELLDEGVTETFRLTEKVLVNGELQKKFRDGHECVCSFTGVGANRVLEVHADLLSPQHRRALLDHCKSLFNRKIVIK